MFSILFISLRPQDDSSRTNEFPRVPSTSPGIPSKDRTLLELRRQFRNVADRSKEQRGRQPEGTSTPKYLIGRIVWIFGIFNFHVGLLRPRPAKCLSGHREVASLGLTSKSLGKGGVLSGCHQKRSIQIQCQRRKAGR